MGKSIHSGSFLMTAQDALVAIMVAGGASDEDISNRELVSISRIVDHLPIFKDYDPARIKTIAETVFDLFEEEDGLDALFGLVKEALPEKSLSLRPSLNEFENFDTINFVLGCSLTAFSIYIVEIIYYPNPIRIPLITCESYSLHVLSSSPPLLA